MEAKVSYVSTNQGKTLSDCSLVFSQRRAKALELFASKGFAEVGMRELAAFIGITPGALYHHYPSKQHLLFDFVEEFYEELIAIFRCTPGEKNLSFRQVIDRHLSLYRDIPWHFKIAMRETVSLLPEQQEFIRELKAEYHVQLKEALGFADAQDEETRGAVAAIALLLSAAPTWLSELTAPTDVLRLVTENALRGAIEKIVQSRYPISYECALVL